MKYYRVYLKNAGNIFIGAINTKEGLVPSPTEEIWYSFETCGIIHLTPRNDGKKDISMSLIDNSPVGQFKAYFFPTIYETKELEEILPQEKIGVQHDIVNGGASQDIGERKGVEDAYSPINCNARQEINKTRGRPCKVKN